MIDDANRITALQLAIDSLKAQPDADPVEVAETFYNFIIGNRTFNLGNTINVCQCDSVLDTGEFRVRCLGAKNHAHSHIGWSENSKITADGLWRWDD